VATLILGLAGLTLVILRNSRIVDAAKTEATDPETASEGGEGKTPPNATEDRRVLLSVEALRQAAEDSEKRQASNARCQGLGATWAATAVKLDRADYNPFPHYSTWVRCTYVWMTTLPLPYFWSVISGSTPADGSIRPIQDGFVTGFKMGDYTRFYFGASWDTRLYYWGIQPYAVL